jgi:penicillin-binding protein-related factor A (putative recombinase)
MRKGAVLEKSILKLFGVYQTLGIFCIQIHPRRLTNGQNTEKAPFDFLCFHKGRVVAFDTKECAAPRFPTAPNHQIAALECINRNGGEGFFLVYFSSLKKLVKFKPMQCIKSVLPEEGELLKSIDILNVGDKK